MPGQVLVAENKCQAKGGKNESWGIKEGLSGGVLSIRGMVLNFQMHTCQLICRAKIMSVEMDWMAVLGSCIRDWPS